jgi:hypothetical protein
MTGKGAIAKKKSVGNCKSCCGSEELSHELMRSIMIMKKPKTKYLN